MYPAEVVKCNLVASHSFTVVTILSEGRWTTDDGRQTTDDRPRMIVDENNFPNNPVS